MLPKTYKNIMNVFHNYKYFVLSFDKNMLVPIAT